MESWLLVGRCCQFCVVAVFLTLRVYNSFVGRDDVMPQSSLAFAVLGWLSTMSVSH
jgi:hypothetical protein